MSRGRNVPPPNPDLQAAKKFVVLYYDTLDNKRDKLVHLYGDPCKLLFDGNMYVGGGDINTFWQNYFPESHHVILCQDYKRYGAFLICSNSGMVRFSSGDRPFSQVITCHNTDDDSRWKILSDNYRLMG